MKNLFFLGLIILLLVVAPTLAATRDGDQPDREMLRMMEFLREMEMIRQIEMMQDMQQLEQSADQAPRGAPQTSAPAKRKEAAR